MALRLTDDEIWHWHKVMEHFLTSGMTAKKFCTEYNYDEKVFTVRYGRMIYMSKSNPVRYAKIMPLAKKYVNSGMAPMEFCKLHDIDASTLSLAATHFNYLEAIERIKKEKEKMPMQFVEVPPKDIFIPPKEPEVISKKNDIELIIDKGIKVSIASHISSEKIIKIIEMMKDL